MSENIVFILILTILTLDFVFDKILEYLNSRNWSTNIPIEIKGIYDEEKYAKSQRYDKYNTRLSVVSSSFSFLLIIVVLWFNGFAIIDSWVKGFTDNSILQALLFFGSIGLASDILGIPFAIYHTFVIEKRFSFNKMTALTFVLDKLKSWLLIAVIGGGLLSLIVLIYQETGEWFALFVWISIAVFMIFMSMFYSNLIVPLFNKQKPLENGALRDAIHNFASKVGFKLDNIYVIDGSKRSTKANAYFTGLGAKKRIVLYDTLISQHTTDELVAVLAHEIGHYKKRHTVSSLIIGLFEMALMLVLLSWIIRTPLLSQALGADDYSFHLSLLAFGILYSPVSFILGLFTKALSRYNEYQADNFAGVNFSPQQLKSALIKLSIHHLSNLKPHPWYVFVHYSHPTLLQRLKALDKIHSD